MNKRKSIRFLIQFFFALLLLVGAELLFACFGVRPEDGKSTLYQFYLSLLFALDLPILGCLAGYRRWIGALAAYGVTLCLKVSSFRIFTSPLYGMVLRFENWQAALWVLLGVQTLLTIGVAAFGYWLRRRGGGLSMPGEH